ncbi:DUF5685 family protein [Nocardia shimofusensis]|uniref:DUF5685 family protein n=1 Tax=Nocardia shimofusensis TaxID=228596 RepID=UPI000832E4C7|nr:DUF5685 family protein [Nocardia shimofusensis]
MFGMLRPCSHGAAKYGIDSSQWQAHMCGLCLGLRDGHGQLARTATNTDAIVLSVLTEAQSVEAAERVTAGRCALRAMRRAEVAPAAAPGVRLATTASLLLGSAALRDHVDDGDAAVLTRGPMARVSTSWAASARTQAALIGLDVEPLVAEIGAQTERERTSTDLAELTAATELCAAEFFAHTAILAGRPENVDELRAAGGNFGRIAHLADAVEDLEDDRAAGRFNALDAARTPLTEAYDLIHESEAQLRRSLVAAELAEIPTVRWMLLDPLHTLVHRIGRGVPGAITHACTASRRQAGPPISTRKRPPARRPGLGEGIALTLGVYCTGYACFAEHTNPCTGKREDAWWKRCCDCGNCCSGCPDCGNCCSCDGCNCCDC